MLSYTSRSKEQLCRKAERRCLVCMPSAMLNLSSQHPGSFAISAVWLTAHGNWKQPLRLTTWCTRCTRHAPRMVIASIWVHRVINLRDGIKGACKRHPADLHCRAAAVSTRVLAARTVVQATRPSRASAMIFAACDRRRDICIRGQGRLEFADVALDPYHEKQPAPVAHGGRRRSSQAPAVPVSARFEFRAARRGPSGGALARRAAHERLRLVPGRLEVAGCAGGDDAVVLLDRLPAFSGAESACMQRGL